jgi:FkbM family methyltransferase
MVVAGRKTLTDVFDVDRAAERLIDARGHRHRRPSHGVSVSKTAEVTKAEAVGALARLRRAQPSSRLGRLLIGGHRIGWSVLVRLSGRHVEFHKKMFWGGYHDGVLPEATSAMIYRWGVTDWSVARSMVEFLSEGAVFMDVGAHFGSFTLLGSWLVGEEGAVLSIEAMPSTFAHLQKNVSRNRAFDNVLLHRGAAHSEGATLAFNDYGAVFSSLNSVFAARGSGGSRFAETKKVAVDAMRIDDMPMTKQIERLDLVKIDVESSEISALSGMTRLVERFRPKFIVEVSDGTAFEQEKSNELMDWFFERGYRPFRWVGGLLEPYERPGPIGYENFIFVPT